MNFSLEKFDKLLADAEDAAAQFDGRILAQATAALSSYIDGYIAHPSCDAQALEHIRGRLQRYQSLCTFLQQTLRSVLLGALGGSDTSGYGALPQAGNKAAKPTSFGAPTQHLAPLIRRYC